MKYYPVPEQLQKIRRMLSMAENSYRRAHNPSDDACEKFESRILKLREELSKLNLKYPLAGREIL